MAVLIEVAGAALNRNFINLIRPKFPCDTFFDLAGGDLTRVTRNRTRLGPDGIIGGTPVASAQGVQFKGAVSWLDTQRYLGESFSLYAVARMLTAPSTTPEGKGAIASDYGGSTYPDLGRTSFSLEGSATTGAPGGLIRGNLRYAEGASTAAAVAEAPAALTAWAAYGFIVRSGIDIRVVNFTRGYNTTTPFTQTRDVNDAFTALLGSSHANVVQADIVLNKFAAHFTIGHTPEQSAVAYQTLKVQAAYSGVTV
jgi:hypothetical protein